MDCATGELQGMRKNFGNQVIVLLELFVGEMFDHIVSHIPHRHSVVTAEDIVFFVVNVHDINILHFRIGIFFFGVGKKIFFLLGKEIEKVFAIFNKRMVVLFFQGSNAQLYILFLGSLRMPRKMRGKSTREWVD